MADAQEERGRATAFRLMTEEDMTLASAGGLVPKREIDEKDGYFHLSAENQLIETANLHFDGHDVLYALGFPVRSLGADLKWELAPKRGEEFPHYYDDALDIRLAETKLTLTRRPGGSFAVVATEEV